MNTAQKVRVGLVKIIAILLMTMTVRLAYGLGLGNMVIASNLDQPLDASIELLAQGNDNLSSIQVSIADKEQFEEFGIEYPDYVKDLVVSVVDKNIKVGSGDVVIKEPFIHFLIQVDWSGGRFVREYTALIDPPTYAKDSPKPLIAPKVIGDDVVYSQDTATAVDTGSIDSVEEVDESVGTDGVIADSANYNTDARYGPVAAGESLSQIAHDLQRQYPDLSIYQIMAVLFNENQDAFINGNINGLLKGSVLELSDISTVKDYALEEAKALFSKHLTEWDPSYLSSAAETGGIKIAQDEYKDSDDSIFGDDADTTSQDNAGSEQFVVGAGDEFETALSSGDNKADSGEVATLQREITELESSLQSSRLENQELKERISILEGQLADVNRLMSLDVQDAELANLEATLAQQNNEVADVLSEEAVTEAEMAIGDDELVQDVAEADIAIDDSEFELQQDDAEALTDADVAESDVEIIDDDALLELADDESQIAGLEGEEEVQEESEENQAPAPTIKIKSEPSFMETVSNSLGGSLWKILGTVGAVLLGVFGLIIYRRRRADEEFEISMLSVGSQSTQESAGEEVAGFKTIESLSEHPANEISPRTDDAVSEVDNEVEAVDEENVDDVQAVEPTTKETSFLTVYSDSDAVVETDEVDPIAEADVYIAYGREEQAEEVLKDGILSSPERADIKHKLLTLYHKKEKVEDFERLAEELYAEKDNLDAGIWQDVAEMGSSLSPSNPLFELSEADLQVAAESDSFDDEAKAADETGSEQALDDTEETDLNDIDFADIDTMQDVEAKSEHVEIDLDLDDSVEFDNVDLSDRAIDLVEEDTAEDDSDNDEEEQASESFTSEVSDMEIEGEYDEARTQYELAKVFVDLGDKDGAEKVLQEIIDNSNNSEEVINDAKELLDSLS